MTDIWSACSAFDTDAITAILAQSKDNANACDSYRMVPLHHVAKACGGANAGVAVTVARLLLDAGAHPTEKNNNGIAPIHLAAKMGNLELVKLLVGKDDEAPSARTRDGKLPADFAESAGHSDVANYLKALT